MNHREDGNWRGLTTRAEAAARQHDMLLREREAIVRERERLCLRLQTLAEQYDAAAIRARRFLDEVRAALATPVADGGGGGPASKAPRSGS